MAITMTRTRPQVDPVGVSPNLPDPEVPERAQRRRFSAEYKARILMEADACTKPGQIGALLRREGLYSSHLVEWRRQREQGALAALAPKTRGRKPANPLEEEVRRVRAENEQLRNRLAQAEAVMEVQKNSAICWGSRRRPTSVEGPTDGSGNRALDAGGSRPRR